MTMEQEMNQIYRGIADTVNEMIPEKWLMYYMYAQVSETGGGIYFFYNTPENEHYFKYSLEIPFEFDINREHHKQLERNLFELCNKLRIVFAKYKQELWYSITFSLGDQGEFKIHFDYTNWFDTDYSFDDQLTIWEYKYLGNEPVNAEGRELIERYLIEYPDNPI